MQMKLSQKMWISLGILSIFIVTLVVVQAADKDQKKENTSKAKMLKVQFSTQTSNGKYSPKNVGAVWLSDTNGNYKSTLYIWGKKQNKQLKDWIAAKKVQRTDAVTGATRKNHNTPIVFTCALPATPESLDKLSLNMMVTDSNKAQKKHMTDIALTSLTLSNAFTIDSQDGFENITVELMEAQKK